MTRKRIKPYRATKAVKAVARALMGAPPPTIAIPDKKRKQKEGGKHKQSMTSLLAEDQQ